jgi:cellulose biosynthesis protein BcsQ
MIETIMVASGMIDLLPLADVVERATIRATQFDFDVLPLPSADPKSQVESRAVGLEDTIRDQTSEWQESVSRIVDVTGDKYDVIIIDTSPRHGSLASMAFVASDAILLALDSSPASLKSVKKMIDVVSEYQSAGASCRVLGAIMFANTRTRSAAMGEDILKHWEVPVLGGVLPFARSPLDIAVIEHRPLGKGPDTKLTVAYDAVASDVMRRLEAPVKKIRKSTRKVA